MAAVAAFAADDAAEVRGSFVVAGAAMSASAASAEDVEPVGGAAGAALAADGAPPEAMLET